MTSTRDGVGLLRLDGSPALTYLHAPAWFGLDIMIRAGLLWPGSFETRTVDQLSRPELDQPHRTGVVVDLRGVPVSSNELTLLLQQRTGHPTVVVAEQEPPPDFRLLGLRVLGPADLALPLPQVADLLRSGGFAPVQSALQAIHRESGGWPLLVEAAAAGLRRDDPEADVSAAIAVMRRVAADTVLPRLPGRWRQIIDRVAVLDGLAAPEVDALPRDAVAVVHEMLVANLLVSRSSEDGTVLTLVPAVGAAAITDLASDPAALARLRRDGALSRHRLGVLDAGLTAALEARDYELCAEILDTWTMKFSFTRHRAIGQRAVLALPSEALVGRPIASLRGEFLGSVPLGGTPLRFPATGPELRAAVRTGAARRLVEQSFLALVGHRSSYRYGAATQIARATGPLVDLGVRAVHSSVAGIASLWYLQAGLAEQLHGNFAGARQYYNRGWQERAYDELGFVSRDLASKLALIHAVEGRGATSRRWLSTFPNLPSDVGQVDHWINYGVGAAHLVLAVEDLRSPDVDAWERKHDDGFERDELFIHVAEARVRWALSLGQPGSARQLLADVLARSVATASDGVHPATLRALEAETWLAEGKAHPAAHLLNEIPASAPQRRVPQARLMVMTDRPEDSLRAVDHGLAQTDTTLRDQVALQLIKAQAADLLGDSSVAITAIGSATRTINIEGLRRALTTVPGELLAKYADYVPGLADTLAELRRDGWLPIHPGRTAMVTLSDRERSVLQALAAGGTNSHIAASLFLSENTIKTHLRTLYAKLGTKTRDGAVAQGRALGLIT
ncbi:LuxR C-terminal-related transcriptional regulator [Nocardioides sp. Bht2]|uniref:LuxR C-terminal-related transcriptional regulator n=1 Tax=Nocardioides sp. Bht2 TaxID=3392297 RepID=UPI0039B61C92